MITAKQWVKMASNVMSRNDMAVEEFNGDIRRMDAGETFILSQQLENMMAESFDVIFAPLNARSFFPVRSTSSPGATSVVYRQYERFGQAKKISDFADDLPRVTAQGKRFEHEIISLGDAYELSIQDVRAATFANVPLDAELVRAARQGMEQTINTLALSGDATAGVPGFLNHASIPSGAATTGTWSTATPDQINEDIGAAKQAVITATYQQMPPTHCLLPVVQQARMGQRMTGGSDKTVLGFVKEAYPEIMFEFTHELSTEIFVYNKSPRTGWIEIPLEFEQFPPQWTNLAYLVNCHSRCGGAIVPYPIAFYRQTGI